MLLIYLDHYSIRKFSLIKQIFLHFYLIPCLIPSLVLKNGIVATSDILKDTFKYLFNKNIFVSGF